MRRTWSIAVARDPADDATWQRVGEVMRAWTAKATVTPIGEIMWMADTDSALIADALTEAITALGVEPLRSWRTVYDEADYTVADFIGITGIDLSLQPPFVLNNPGSYTTDAPCPQCGQRDMFGFAADVVPRIDEDLLDVPAPVGARPGPSGWEVVNLPDGGLLLSTRLVTELLDAGVRGVVTDDVLDATGAPSTRMARLRAPVAVPAPCPRHARVEDGEFCPTCGTANGTLDGYFWMPSSVVGDAEVVSTHPTRAAVFSMSRRAFAILAMIPGVRRGDPVRICDD